MIKTLSLTRHIPVIGDQVLNNQYSLSPRDLGNRWAYEYEMSSLELDTDDASRRIDTLNYGTNDSSGFVSGTSAPSTPFDTNRGTSAALISSVAFDEWGRVVRTTDPDDKDTLTVYDDLSRSIAVVESQSSIDAGDITWNGTTENWQVGWTGTPPADQDRVTTFVYDGNSNVTKRTAHINGGGVQVTEYVYGTTAVTSSPGTMDSLVGSSNLLSAVHYPNESTGAADSSSAYTVSYAYNRLGELRGMTDQNGTVHKLTRDDLGRMTGDEAQTLGTNIDGSVREITASFDNHGRIDTVQSLNASSAVVNSVEFNYTPLHQIEEVVQDVDGAGSIASETVEYIYADAAPSGSGGDYSRITGIRYPSDYGGSYDTISVDYTGETDFDVINDRISRVYAYSSPSWNNTTPVDLVSYRYLGQGITAQVDYGSISTMLDAVRGYDGSSTSGEYPGYDQYGRRVWHAWVNHSFAAGSNPGQPNATPLMARRYAYDRMSNRTYDWDGRPGAVADDRDWHYEYDGLDRLETATRGLRNSETSPSSIGTIADQSRQWNLDMLGNWGSVVTDLDGDGLFETGDETEDRSHNSANELTSREGPVGSGVTFAPIYDNAGNFRSNNATGSSDLEYTHDAWNRLVKVEKVLGSGARTTVLRNTYNGLNWRVTREVDLSKGAYDGVDEKRAYYYSAGWQMVEEHVDSDLGTNSDSTGGSDDDADRVSQQVWGARYIDDAVAKRITEDSASRWYFYLTDAMFSVRALTDSTGFVQERIDYTPYGVAQHRYSADVNDDGALSYFDVAAMVNNVTNTLEPGDSGYDPDADLNGDGMNGFDTGEFTAIYSAMSSNTVPDGWITDPTDSTWTDNTIGYDGYFFDYAGASDASASGVYCVRHRTYDPGLANWLEEDFAQYSEGSSLYVYAIDNPTTLSDSSGLTASYIASGPGGNGGANGIVIDYDDGMPILRPKGDPMSTPGATACDGYAPYENTSCMNSKGCWVPDPYPASAHLICRRFLQQYGFSSTVQCVAKCLTSQEGFHTFIPDCDLRNRLRLRAHAKCYSQCGFFPTKGLPPGAPKVGWEDLLPSEIRGWWQTIIDNTPEEWPRHPWM